MSWDRGEEGSERERAGTTGTHVCIWPQAWYCADTVWYMTCIPCSVGLARCALRSNGSGQPWRVHVAQHATEDGRMTPRLGLVDECRLGFNIPKPTELPVFYVDISQMACSGCAGGRMHTTLGARGVPQSLQTTAQFLSAYPMRNRGCSIAARASGPTPDGAQRLQREENGPLRLSCHAHVVPIMLII